MLHRHPRLEKVAEPSVWHEDTPSLENLQGERLKEG